MSTTPRPWKVIYGEREDEQDEVWAIMQASEPSYYRGKKIVETDMGAYNPSKDDAELIVLAVNEHDTLQARLDTAEERIRAFDKIGGAFQEGTDAIHKMVTEMLDNRAKLAHLEGLVKGLPKYEGEIAVIQDTDVFWQVCWRGDDGELELVCDHMNKREADAIAALLQERNGMK